MFLNCKNDFTIESSNSTSWHIPTRVENRDSDICTATFTVTWFTAAKRWEQCASLDKRINKIQCIHTIKYLALREGSSGTCYNIEETWRHHAQWNKADAKGQILYDSSYVKSLDVSHPKRLKVEWWLPRAGGGGNGELLLIGYGVSVWENVLEMLATVAHKVSVLNVSEMYTY